MKFQLNAQTRALQGSGASRRLRRANKVPGIIYGGSAEPQLIELDHNELLLALRKEAFHSTVISVKLGGTEQSVLLRDSQMHPYKPLVLHVDFLRVDTTHAIHQKVPLHFMNQEAAPGVKVGGGTVSHAMNEVDVTCLPQDLPAFIEVDLKDLEAGQTLHVSQLTYPKGVKPVMHGGEDPLVVTITLKKAGAEAADEAAEGGEAAPAGTPPAA
ncbi:50S ribosomal protein L25/general stress protein Ctc [Propionivibrio soli]|jgi:large subunit ribosomal protein L25|uniref:50S ribosomal protein L25/general stress protein Ctc n=1 Tax=Propionivibrio soli TaxID=2976531 RepID=UPI0021E73FA3|nr:50S ribosomal protein L25/general stress protein Ctc [Propionivibrio soli]